MTKLIQDSLITACLIITACFDSTFSGSFFTQAWNRDFQLRGLENGDTLGVEAVYSDGKTVYLYDQADGNLVQLSDKGAVIARTKLESIGRDTYAGDDFIVKDTTAIFINSVDKRIEYFSVKTGKHIMGVNIPSDLLASEPRRMYRIVNRIFPDSAGFLLGNDRRLVPFNEKLGKQEASAKILSAPSDMRFAYKDSRRTMYSQNNLLTDSSGKQYRQPPTHFPVNGKRIFILGNKPYALSLTPDSIRIVSLQ